MFYQNSLKKLRKENAFQGEQEPVLAPSPRKPSLIAPRQAPVAAPETDNPLAFLNEYARAIYEAGATVRGKTKARSEQTSRLAGQRRLVTEEAVAEQPYESALEIEEDLPSREEKNSPLDGVVPGKKLSGEAKNWLDVMDRTEGGGSYSALFGHSQNSRFKGIDVSRMTLGQLREFSRPDGPYGQWVKSQVGRVATPMGRYQFVGSTLFRVAEQMGLPDSTVFSADVQDRMFEYQLRQRLSRGNTLLEKVEQVRQEWEGFKNVPTAQLIDLVKRTA